METGSSKQARSGRGRQGRKPAETAPAGQPSAGRRGGDTGRSAKGEATQGHRAKWGRAARGDHVGVQVERQEKEEKTGRSAKYKAACEPKGWARGTRAPSRTTENAASQRR